MLDAIIGLIIFGNRIHFQLKFLGKLKKKFLFFNLKKNPSKLMYWYNTVSLHTFAARQFFFLMHCSEFFTFKNLKVLCVSEQTNKQTNITELILFKDLEHQ
jgi:hypothetical protein